MANKLEDIRKLLDRPYLFDCVDIHSLGDPTEIEENVSSIQPMAATQEAPAASETESTRILLTPQPVFITCR